MEREAKVVAIYTVRRSTQIWLMNCAQWTIYRLLNNKKREREKISVQVQLSPLADIEPSLFRHCDAPARVGLWVHETWVD